MKIAVTAATGRLGQAILHALAEMADSPERVAICRSPDKLAITGTEARQADYGSTAQMSAALQDIDTAIMISAPVVAGTDREALEANVIDAARRAGIRRLIYTSVIGNGTELETGFGPNQRITRATEERVTGSGIDALIARNGLYLDLDLRHIVRSGAHGVYRNNGGAGRCGYISIAELGHAIAAMAVMTRPAAGIYNLYSECVTQQELVGAANEVFGLQLDYRAETLEESVARLMQDPKIAVRGEIVARMLAGVFEAMERGAFEVPCHFEVAAGRPPKSLRAQMQELKPALTG